VAEIHARRELMRARGYVETGGHAQALDALSNIQPFWRTLSPRVADEFLSLFAETQSRCGQMGGLDALRHLQARRPTNLDVITTALNTHLHLGLTPHPDTSNWVLRGDHLLARATAHVPSQRAAFLYSKGCFLNRTGRAREALPVLSEATRLAEMDPSRQPFLGRALAELAEAHRLTQNLREARRLLVQARHLQRRLGCDGDLAGWTLLYRAKLESRSEHAAPWLERADRLLRQCRDSVGEVRCCLLKARFTREPALLASLQGRISVLREPRPALLNCPKLTHLLRHWHEWSGGNFGPDEHGDFFWGI
jgi:tetratricopeptide (TPR) repeat protein